MIWILNQRWQKPSSRMALIYANAVNKRMNNPISKPKKKHTPPCSFLDDSPAGTARDGRKRSTSREATPLRKTSCNLPLHLQANHSYTGSDVLTSTQLSHRPVQRSKTSCGELSNRDNDDDTLRKISHPAISQSATSQTICGRRIDDKRSLAKKSLIQKYNLEHVYDEGEEQLEGRRRSISLDPEQWFEQVTEQGDKQKKDGAFQKMKRKFSKWKLSGRME